MKVNIVNQEFVTVLLSDKGLSMTDTQSISNFCNQQALEIERILDGANVHDKRFTFQGKEYPVTEGKSLPSDVIPLLLEKANYHACQAWLMEAMKEKENLLNLVRQEEFIYHIEMPKPLNLLQPDLIRHVKYGLEILSYSERIDYLKNEAMASHLGGFIHKGGKLDKLRKQNAEEILLEFVDMGNTGKIPVKVTRNHDSNWLLELHNELSNQHREFERKVNYYKAKLKNAENTKNFQIEEQNAEKQREIQAKNDILQKDYREAYENWSISRNIAESEFEKNRFNLLRKISDLKITVEPYFQPILDKFNRKVGNQ